MVNQFYAEIDPILDCFESDWKIGKRPVIDHYLTKSSPPATQVLLEELIKIDVEYRSTTEQPASPEIYEKFGDGATSLAKNQLEKISRMPVSFGVTALAQRTIGDYRLLEKIGEGGMGTVYKAENPLNQLVAIKVIRSEFDSEEAITRFELEKRALARMEHRNIASVYHAGIEDGHPYLVMELVKGKPLIEFCDEHAIDVRQRLGLMVDLCAAIHHAHQKGIIHRDIKPSNVLVAWVDEELVVKVIDFGLAKPLDQADRLTDESFVTRFEKVIGTLRYMSPEQAALNTRDIDIRTDIYSLGAMLYEMLTGDTPLTKDSVKGRTTLQILEAIRDAEPESPGNRLASDPRKERIAERKKTTAARLESILRGELDWIILKALEKERDRRYESAHEFGNDIRRHLEGDVVLARPPSRTYKFRKFVRRNRTLVQAATAIATIIMLGAFGTTFGLIQASMALKTSKTNESRANVTAKRTRDVFEIVINSFRSVSPNEKGGGVQMSAADVLVAAQKSLAASQLDDEGRVYLLATLTDCFSDLGKDRMAIQTGLEDLAIRERMWGFDDPRTLESAHNLASNYRVVGDYKNSIKLFDETISSLKQQFGDGDSRTLDSLNGLAVVLEDAGQGEEAFQMLHTVLEKRHDRFGPRDRATISSINNLGLALNERGRIGESIELLERALAAANKHNGPEHLQTLTIKNNLALAYVNDGRIDDAMSMHRDVLIIRKAKLGMEHPDTLQSMQNLADAKAENGEHETAIQEMEEVWELKKQWLDSDHPSTLLTMNNLAVALGTVGRPRDSMDLLKQVVESRSEKLGEDHPDTLRSMLNLGTAFQSNGLAAAGLPVAIRAYELCVARMGKEHEMTYMSMNNLGAAYIAVGQYAKAILMLEQVVKHRSQQFGEFHSLTLNCKNNLATAYQNSGYPARAIPIFEQVLGELNEEKAERTVFGLTLMNNLASAYQANGEAKKSIPLFEKALRLFQEILGNNHPNTIGSMGNLAGAYGDANRNEDAISLFEKSLALGTKRLGPQHPYSLTFANNLATVFQKINEHGKAINLLTTTLELLEQELGPNNPLTLTAMNNLATAYLSSRNIEKALAILKKTWLNRVKVLGPTHSDTLTSLNNLAFCYLAAENSEQAVDHFSELREILTKKHSETHERTLLTTNVLATAYEQNGQLAIACRLLEEALEKSRNANGDEHPASVEIMGSLGEILVKDGEFSQAELLLSECLAHRHTMHPPTWKSFDTRSWLGAAMLGQNKFDEAKPHLLAGYRGLNEVASQIPVFASSCRLSAVDRIIKYFESMDDENNVSKWKKERNRLIATENNIRFDE